MKLKRALASLSLISYVATIWGANWAITHLGQCTEQPPCVVPVGLGLLAPSGVLFVGTALVLRDAVQQTLGRWWSVAAIVVGAGLSALLSPALALASGTAFLLSELADFSVYTPLRARGQLAAAILVSGLVGGFVDSAVFLGLAFGTWTYLQGQWLGKTEMAVLATVIVWLWQAGHRHWRSSAT